MATSASIDQPSSAVELTLHAKREAATEWSSGIWSPRSTNLGAELPALVVELARRGVRVVRVTYNPELWDEAPRKVRVGSQVVKLGWFRSLDPHAVNLTGGGSEHIALVAAFPAQPATHSAEEVHHAAAAEAR